MNNKKLIIGRGCGKRIVERRDGIKIGYICRTERLSVGELNHLCPTCKNKEEKIDGSKAFEPILEEMRK